MRIEAAVVAGSEGFWREVAKCYPEIKTGDIDPETEIALATAMAEAVARWVELNRPPSSRRGGPE